MSSDCSEDALSHMWLLGDSFEEDDIMANPGYCCKKLSSVIKKGILVGHYGPIHLQQGEIICPS